MLSANVMSLYILGQEEGGEVRGRGSRQHWCWNDVNFGAMRNLHTKQEQIDDSSKQKVLFGLLVIGNWSEAETRCVYQGDPEGGRLNFLRWLQQDLSSICSFTM